MIEDNKTDPDRAAMINAVLALYGLPEPRGSDGVVSIAKVMHYVASYLRSSGIHPTITAQDLQAKMPKEAWGYYESMVKELGL